MTDLNRHAFRRTWPTTRIVAAKIVVVTARCVIATASLVIITASLIGICRAADIVDIKYLENRETVYQAFEITEATTVRVRCVGSVGSSPSEIVAYGWLLDASSRRVLWRLTQDNSRSSKGINRVHVGELRLQPGHYIAYFSSNWTGQVRELTIMGRKILRIGRATKRPAEGQRWSLKMSVADDDGHFNVKRLPELPPVDNKNTFVQFVQMGDSEYESRGFSLPARMRILVRCLGEFTEFQKGPVDKGWILNAKTRKRVWEFGPDNFSYAGGAKKNRMTRENITLPAGDYLACYATDDSHSYDSWNDVPPYDPQSWGMVLSASSTEDVARIVPFSDDADKANRIISLIRQRDGAYVTQGFSLNKLQKLRVICLGEYDDRNHEFADGGWITRFPKDQVVWRMSSRNTSHAGGADKNRLADTVIELPAGDYVAYYATDNSHSYKSWNGEPPYDPAYWGMQIYAVNIEANAGEYTYFDADKRRLHTDDFLARLVRVQSDKHVRSTFTLNEPTRVRVIAIGEGGDGEMYDYGWIQNVSDGAWVWEMTLRKTGHAGGARKNRSFDGFVQLDPGDYEVHFVTDDSHAWGDFNNPRPRQPQRWGITVIRAQ